MTTNSCPTFFSVSAAAKSRFAFTYVSFRPSTAPRRLGSRLSTPGSSRGLAPWPTTRSAAGVCARRAPPAKTGPGETNRWTSRTLHKKFMGRTRTCAPHPVRSSRIPLAPRGGRAPPRLHAAPHRPFSSPASSPSPPHSPDLKPERLPPRRSTPPTPPPPPSRTLRIAPPAPRCRPTAPRACRPARPAA